MKLRILVLFMVMGLVLAACAPAAAPIATPRPTTPPPTTAPPTAVPPTAAPPSLGTAQNPIVLSMVPSGDTEEILQGGEEITALLEEKTGLVFDVNVATSYAAVIEAMCAEKAHMATLATFSYLLAHEKCGVDCALVSVRYGSPYYKGQIIAGADTGIESLEDIAGKTMCWVDATSTSGYIVPRVSLMAAGVDPETDLAQQVEAGSHNNVVLSVYRGDCDAGATFVDARGNVAAEFPDVNEKVLVIEESAEIPNDGLQFIAGFPADLRAKIVDAFIELMGTEEGKAAMSKAYQWSEVIEKDDSFYDGFRATLNAAGVDIAELENPPPIPKVELGTAEDPIVLSMVPSGDTEEILQGGEEITQLLAEKTGLVFDVNVATSYAAVIEAMGAKKAHMATLATFSYLLAHEKYGVDAALVSVRYGSPYYKGQIIAGVDTGIQTLEDLKGKTMCWVDATSTSGYIVPRVMILAAGVDPDTDLAQQVEAGSHDNVVLSVYRGDCDAGATFVDARGNVADEFPDVNDKVVVVAESAEIPNDGLQFVADFPADLRRQIVAAFVELMQTEEGKAAMQKAYQWSEVIEKDDSFYDGFRATLNASGVDIAELGQ
jgi:phosphonate transport system substrate-binding protein